MQNKMHKKFSPDSLNTMITNGELDEILDVSLYSGEQLLVMPALYAGWRRKKMKAESMLL